MRCFCSRDTRVQHLVHLTPSDQRTSEVFQQVAELYLSSRRVEVRVHPFAWRSSGERCLFLLASHRRQTSF